MLDMMSPPEGHETFLFLKYGPKPASFCVYFHRLLKK